MATSAKRQRMEVEEEDKMELLYFPNEVLSEIIRRLPVKDRVLLGSTCNRLYELEKKTRGRNIDVVRIEGFSISVFSALIGDRHLRRTKDSSKLFNNAHISCLDATGICVPMQNTQNLPSFLESSMFGVLKARLISSDPKLRSTISWLANSPSFTRDALHLTWSPSNLEKREYEKFLLSLPITRSLRLSYTGINGHKSAPSVDTILQLVTRYQDLMVYTPTTEETKPMLHEIFKMVQYSPGSKRVRLECVLSHDIEDFGKVKLERDYERVNYNCIRHRPTGTVMIFGLYDNHCLVTICKGAAIPECLYLQPLYFCY
ncbi:hypothetical protein PFISCL1PPCAC_4946 [Pristionchus fissidentatus]|uniref:F-box domain-containing protein n=1 Tax=Pristionchus fissidentatus TaxID=1538716 RepID=A0AAV5V518_9BILA|nr:hypothetical protein PFISCL1PPCAC_4946 [Pristionchus fissidentatus]